MVPCVLRNSLTDLASTTELRAGDTTIMRYQAIQSFVTQLCKARSVSSLLFKHTLYKHTTKELFVFSKMKV